MTIEGKRNKLTPSGIGKPTEKITDLSEKPNVVFYYETPKFIIKEEEQKQKILREKINILKRAHPSSKKQQNIIKRKIRNLEDEIMESKKRAKEFGHDLNKLEFELALRKATGEKLNISDREKLENMTTYAGRRYKRNKIFKLREIEKAYEMRKPKNSWFLKLRDDIEENKMIIRLMAPVEAFPFGESSLISEIVQILDLNGKVPDMSEEIHFRSPIKQEGRLIIADVEVKYLKKEGVARRRDLK